MTKLGNILKSLKGKAVLNALPMAATGAIAAALYALGVVVKPGLLTYLISLPPLAVLSITALARVNDIKKDRVGFLWQCRRVGLSLTGAAALVIMFTPWADATAYPTWKELLIYYGFALTWLTTPHMPPWWVYISKGQPVTKASD